MLYQDEIYGQTEINEPVFLELLKTPPLQRLKGVHQNGIYYYAFPEVKLNRFEHSVGVMLLLKRFGASLEEQAAGLLHDISHGAFSHVLDHLYGSTQEQDHQDSKHHTFFNSNLRKILKKHHLEPAKIADLKKWSLLDQPLPDICADRLDYTLRDGWFLNQIDKSTIERILNNLFIGKNKFVFNDFGLALKFANLSYWLCRYYWHIEWGVAIFQLMSQLLQQGLDKKIITENDLYTDDDAVMEKFERNNDPKIVQLVSKLKNFSKNKVATDHQQYDFKLASKLRVIDPLVEVNNNLKRVSQLDEDFKNKFNQEKERVKEMHLKILD